MENTTENNTANTAENIPVKGPSRKEMFLNSLFFVLGFSIVFAALGVLLNSTLENISYDVQLWLSRIGGVIIILFGLFVMGLIKIKFLEQDHKLQVKKKFKSKYATSFTFGFAFAVGWTPCVGFILGAILTLAATQPGIAFGLLLSYTLGLGVPFLIVGLFSSEALRVIQKSTRFLKYFNYVVGIFLIVLGVLVFTQNLARLSSLEFLTGLLSLESSIGLGDQVTLLASFLAGLLSFLSPCILPIIPGFLGYLAGVSGKSSEKRA